VPDLKQAPSRKWWGLVFLWLFSLPSRWASGPDREVMPARADGTVPTFGRDGRVGRCQILNRPHHESGGALFFAWLFSPLPSRWASGPNREVKPARADGTAVTCGRVGRCQILNRPHHESGGALFFYGVFCPPDRGHHYLGILLGNIDKNIGTAYIWFSGMFFADPIVMCNTGCIPTIVQTCI
jgi:hypothetical protein